MVVENQWLSLTFNRKYFCWILLRWLIHRGYHKELMAVPAFQHTQVCISPLQTAIPSPENKLEQWYPSSISLCESHPMRALLWKWAAPINLQWHSVGLLLYCSGLPFYLFTEFPHGVTFWQDRRRLSLATWTLYRKVGYKPESSWVC